MVFENLNSINPVPNPVVYQGGPIAVLLDAALIICPVTNCCDMAGDFNNDGVIDVADLSGPHSITGYMFLGGPPPVCGP